MAFGSEYWRRLQQAREHQRDWRQKVQRLREIVAGVPRGQQLTTRIEEAKTNYMLLNLTLKTSALVSSIRSTRVVFRNAPAELGYWFEDDVKGAAIADLADVLKDRFGCGMGVLGIGSDSGSFLYYIDPLDVWWSPDYGYRSPAWVVRRIVLPRKATRSVVYEYWDAQVHAFFTEAEVLHEESNGLGVIPIRFVENIFSVPGVDFPISDTEMVYPQQRIIDEVRRTLIEQARRGTGFFEYQQDAVDPLELEKLREPGEQFIATETGNAITPKITPPPSAEWLNIEALVKNDLDAQSGVSEYLRGSMPVANNIKFATQVLAALGAQNLRIQADWVPIKELLEWAGYTWLLMAHVNGERHRVGDIVVDAGALDVRQISVKCEEDENAITVSSVGVNPDELQRALVS